MNKKSSFTICCILVILSSCSSSLDYEQLADQVTCQTAHELQEQYSLYFNGLGGAMMDDIQEMYLSLQYYEIVDIDTARGLIVNAIKTYLYNINSDQKIRPYLHNYPFFIKNIEVAIYFKQPDGSLVSSNDICVAFLSRGKITYYIDIPEQIPSLTPLHEETYEEALKKVNSNP